MKTVYRFRFEPEVPLEKAEATLMLAIVAAEALHGQADVRLSFEYLFGEEKHACVIDGDNDVARQLVLIFTQFLIHEFGENAFQVTWEQHEAKPSKATREEPKPGGNGGGRCNACGGKDPEMIRNCEDCTCWEAYRLPADEPPLVGLCRRHAPAARACGAWPQTMALDWCAEAIPAAADEGKRGLET